MRLPTRENPTIPWLPVSADLMSLNPWSPLFWEVASSWKKLVTGAGFLEAYCPLLLLVLTLLPCMQRCETLQHHSYSGRYGCCGLMLHLCRHHELCPLIPLFKVNLSSFQSLLWGDATVMRKITNTEYLY